MKANNIWVTVAIVVAALFCGLSIHNDCKYREAYLNSKRLEINLRDLENLSALQNDVIDACGEYISTIQNPDADQQFLINAYNIFSSRVN